MNCYQLSSEATMRILIFCSHLVLIGANNYDQFTYRDGEGSIPNQIWGPQDWINVRCGELDECVGWPEKFVAAPDWTLSQNDCQWCPAQGNDCGTHHNSPINLERNRAINESEWHNQCIDIHMMHHHDSSCTFDELVRLNAFTIERYALKINQPIEEYDDYYRVACSDNGEHYWAQLDYSRGFSNWWWLSHTDFHVPSEHTQEGKQYDAEMQLYHFYSVPASEAMFGVPNQMGTVSIFLQAYDDQEDYDMLNKIICQWRRVEDETRDQCGLPSVDQEYSGCTHYIRDHEESRNLLKSHVRAGAAAVAKGMLYGPQKDTSTRPHWRSPPSGVASAQEGTGMDWNQTIKRASEQQDFNKYRKLQDFQDVGPWTNYFGLRDVKTEYYFRYSGTQTIPPCYGLFTPGPNNRANTNHWRVMKDPIRVSNRQIDEMHRLLKDRIAPTDDPIRPCQPDTAAAPLDGSESRVNVARPLQSTQNAHFMVFCECRWTSRFEEDQQWCLNSDQLSRLYEQPYNFQSHGF